MLSFFRRWMGRRRPDGLIRAVTLRATLLRLIALMLFLAGLHVLAMVLFEGLTPFQAL